jgi:hypothetical protein
MTNVLWGMLVVAPFYAFTIHRLWHRRRWAWLVCMVPVLVFLVLSLIEVYVLLSSRLSRPVRPSDWVLLGVLLVPSALLAPLQWAMRREI